MTRRSWRQFCTENYFIWLELDKATNSVQMLRVWEKPHKYCRDLSRIIKSCVKIYIQTTDWKIFREQLKDFLKPFKRFEVKKFRGIHLLTGWWVIHLCRKIIDFFRRTKSNGGIRWNQPWFANSDPLKDFFSPQRSANYSMSLLFYT